VNGSWDLIAWHVVAHCGGKPLPGGGQIKLCWGSAFEQFLGMTQHCPGLGWSSQAASVVSWCAQRMF